jgi:hypothetical protein
VLGAILLPMGDTLAAFVARNRCKLLRLDTDELPENFGLTLPEPSERLFYGTPRKLLDLEGFLRSSLASVLDDRCADNAPVSVPLRQISPSLRQVKLVQPPVARPARPRCADRLPVADP